MRKSLVVLLLGMAVPAMAETHQLDKEKTAVLLENAAREGLDLRVKSTVKKSVGVTAVLLTQPAVRRLFGKEIAETYAVVQMTISNRDADAAFVLHSAYIDTSQWALGAGAVKAPDPEAPDDEARAGTSPTRISSVESRIARGQLLDAQQWSARNWTIRLLTVAGSLASGYSFAFKEVGIAKGISAFNGNFVPGVAFAWPDGSVAQINRISDFGYQTNKVIPKQHADVVVCFFPIDLFLSPPARRIFLKSPALFLSPYQLLFGTGNERILEALKLRTDAGALAKLYPCYSKIVEADASTRKRKSESTLSATILENCRTEANGQKDAMADLDYIGRFGLQHIQVFVDGSLTVDVDVVPASIDEVQFDGDASKPEFWAGAGTITGTLKCRFCTGGQVSLNEASTLGITDVTTVTEGSDDSHLKFSFKTTKAIESGQALTFIVTNKSTDPKKSDHEAKSAPSTYVVSYVQTTPSITSVTIESNKVQLAGSSFFNTKANPLTVTLVAASQKEPVTVTPSSVAADSIAFDVPAGLAAGCWTVRVREGAMEASQPAKPSQILVEAVPKLNAATRKGETIVAEGEQMVDTSACGGQDLTFQLLKDGASDAVDVNPQSISATAAKLDLPAEAKTGKWALQVLQGGEVKSSVDLK